MRTESPCCFGLFERLRHCYLEVKPVDNVVICRFKQVKYRMHALCTPPIPALGIVPYCLKLNKA